MKKFLLTLVGVICSLGLWADTETIFSYTAPSSASSAKCTAASTYDFTSAEGTFTSGSTITFINNNTKYASVVTTSSNVIGITFGSGKHFVKIELPLELEAGDVITYSTSTSENLKFGTSTTDCAEIASGNAISNGLVGEDIIYVTRLESSTIRVKSLTITRGGEAPAPATQLAAPGNLGSSNVTATGATLTWDEVENASSYIVKIGTDEHEVSENSYTASGLTASTEYTWQVKAEGDGVNYSASDYSAAAYFTTAEAVPVVYTGTLIKAVISGQKTAEVTGTMTGATADVNLSSAYKLNGGKYVGVKAADGQTFKAGDIVKIHVNSSALAGTYNWYAFNASTASDDNLIFSSTTGGNVEYPQFALTSDQTAIYFVRDNTNANPYGKWNPTFDYIEVIRPVYHNITYAETKGADMSAYPTQYMEGEGIAEFAALANVEGWDFVAWNPTSISAEATENVTITATWKAATQKWNVTFDLQGKGDNFTQVIEDGKKAEKPADDPTNGAYTFTGWTTTAEGGTAFDFEQAITANTTVYAQWNAKAASTSINIEQNALDNASYDYAAALAAANIAYTKGGDNDALDGLNNAKDYRNAPYLGLKLKHATSSFTVVVAPGSTVKVKFGAIQDGVQVSGLSDEKIAATTTGVTKSYPNNGTEVAYVTFTNTKDGKSAVLKQVAVDAEPAAVELPFFGDTRATAAGNYGTICLPFDAKSEGVVLMQMNGKVNEGDAIQFNWVGGSEENATNADLEAGVPYLYRATGDASVKFTCGADSKFTAATTVNGFAGNYDADKDVAENEYFLYTVDNCFHPAQNAEGESNTYVHLGAYRCYIPDMTKVDNADPSMAGAPAVVFGIFEEDQATGIEAISANGEDGKFMLNGQLYIRHNGQLYNAAGQLVK